MEYKYEYGRDTYLFDGDEGIKITSYTPIAPPQQQDRLVGLEYLMFPRPIYDNPNYRGSSKLKGKVAIITGGDSGLGRAAAIAYAKSSHYTGLERSESKPSFAGLLIFWPYRPCESHVF